MSYCRFGRVAHGLGAMIVAVGMTSCAMPTQRKVASVDTLRGQIQSKTAVATAHIVVDKPLKLAPFKGCAVVYWGAYGFDFFRDQIAALGYFDDVLSYPDVQRLIVQRNLTDKIPRPNSPAGTRALYEEYKPCLWIHKDVVNASVGPFDVRFIVTNPQTGEDVCVAERHNSMFSDFTDSMSILDFLNGTKNDQHDRYPLINAFNAWVLRNP
jgi:hypothetical protein